MNGLNKMWFKYQIYSFIFTIQNIFSLTAKWFAQISSALLSFSYIYRGIPTFLSWYYAMNLYKVIFVKRKLTFPCMNIDINSHSDIRLEHIYIEILVTAINYICMRTHKQNLFHINTRKFIFHTRYIILLCLKRN